MTLIQLQYMAINDSTKKTQTPAEINAMMKITLGKLKREKANQ